MEKKYKLTDETKEWHGHTLHRIQALRDFGDVEAGDLGGWVESEDNLSLGNEAWVYDYATVYGNAIVRDNARVYGNAKVCEDAKVCGNAKVSGTAKVYGNAKVGELYSQLATAKIAICLKNAFLGESKLSFSRGLRLILCCILRMKASVSLEKSVPLGIY